MRRVSLLLPWVLLAGAALPSCNRFDPSRPPVIVPAPPSGEGGIGVSSQVVIEHPLFGGLQHVVAGEGLLHLRWVAAEDDNDLPEDIVYQVFLAPGPGDQNFSAPDLVTAPGTVTVTIDGLASGAPIYVVVRAVDLDGNSDRNTIEWIATPNPVRFVNAGSTAPVPGCKSLQKCEMSANIDKQNRHRWALYHRLVSNMWPPTLAICSVPSNTWP